MVSINRGAAAGESIHLLPTRHSFERRIGCHGAVVAGAWVVIAGLVVDVVPFATVVDVVDDVAGAGAGFVAVVSPRRHKKNTSSSAISATAPRIFVFMQRSRCSPLSKPSWYRIASRP